MLKFHFDMDHQPVQTSPNPTDAELAHNVAALTLINGTNSDDRSNSGSRGREGYGFRPVSGRATPVGHDQWQPGGTDEPEENERMGSSSNAVSAIPDVNGLGWPGK